MLIFLDGCRDVPCAPPNATILQPSLYILLFIDSNRITKLRSHQRILCVIPLYQVNNLPIIGRKRPFRSLELQSPVSQNPVRQF